MTDNTTVYETADGETMTFAQIAMASAKNPNVDVEQADDGEAYLVNGVRYEPANEP